MECQVPLEVANSGPQTWFLGNLMWFGFGFWLMESSKNQDISHKIPDFYFLLKPLAIQLPCKCVHVCTCMPRPLLPERCLLPRGTLLLAGLQGCPWRGSKATQESLCADMFSVKGEVAGAAPGPGPPPPALISAIGGANESSKLSPSPSGCAAGYGLQETVTEDNNYTGCLFLSI